MLFTRVQSSSSPLLLLVFFFLIVGRLAAAPTGPTLQLDYGHGEPHSNPISQFMYFVPLISPESVSVFTNPGNTQCARVTSFTCRTNGSSFRAICEFDFTGTGDLRNVFDLTQKIKSHEKELQAGDSIKHVLAAINVAGDGSGDVEIEGDFSNDVCVANQVQMHFNQHGHTSPVTINLQDFVKRDGKVRVENELVARVNTLTFQRNSGAPKMEVSLASIKRKDAGNSLWQSFIGGIKGAAANLFLPPLTIEPEGQQAMLDFGRALAEKKPTFTFPFAPRLKNSASQ